MLSMETKQVIEKAGGARFLAQELGVTTQAVYDWKKVPYKHLFKVSKMAKVKPEDVRPEMFA